MKYSILSAMGWLTAFLGVTSLSAQENVGYQKPPQEILELVDVQAPPSVIMDEANHYMLLLSRNSYKSIEELSQPEMRLGGLRINPKLNISSRANYINNIEIKDLTDSKPVVKAVKGLPVNPKLTNFTWSPDQSKMAFTHTSERGVEAWVLDLATATAKNLTAPTINANLGDVLNWMEDGKSILVKMRAGNRQPLIDAKEAVPAGPTISSNNGKKAQNRTYQDLLKNKTDEHNFEQLALSELYQVFLDGNRRKWLESAMYRGITFSPDGEYVLVTTIEKPFSYLVPYYRFPSKTTVYNKRGESIQVVSEVPLIEDLPQGFMAVREGPRSFAWRNDQASTLVYAQALDGGDPKNEVEHRDELFELKAPFNGKGRSLLKMHQRFYNVIWNSDNMALAFDYWWNTRNTKTYIFDPAAEGNTKPTIISDRNYQDRYSDPGDFETHRNKYGSRVLKVHNGKAFLLGDGFTKEGQFPFIDEFDLKSHKTSRLYQSAYKDKLERIWEYNPDKKEALIRLESPSEYPNYYKRSMGKKDLVQLTDFENPFKSMQGVHKEEIRYQREDGLELSATLYLPLGYDKEKKEKMPMIMWAYPREYKDKASAGQSSQSPNAFTYPYYGSMVYWVTRGYVVLDDASFPIVGEGDEEPNDSFRKQLVANAKAAIDAVDNMGYIDRERVAVAGHSYGAFMVANLLSHSNLFAAGIARSGAYNRTLTPFGFQSEERNYWEAPDLYNTMSPFMHAEKMNQPLLLIHGQEDNNSGTYPMQSERYFNALKGLGAQVRLVMLPKESHGYRAKESILHVLWEQDQWLEKHVKNKSKKQAD